MNRRGCGRAACVAGVLALAVVTGAAADSGTALKLLSITPAGTDVPPGQEIVLQFDRPMVALGNMARGASRVPVHVTPALHCEWRWLNNDELACRLPGEQHLRPATKYTVQVETGFTALDGARLQAAVTQTFTTERPRVKSAWFQDWRSPVLPVYLVSFNLPVTAAEVSRHLRFVRARDENFVPARAQPYTRERHGPLWLPVPGKPGAWLFIANPQPVKPEDAGRPEYAARETWLVEPRAALAAATGYTLTLNPGLTTPLGPLPGAGGIPGDTALTTYGAFRLQGVRCQAGDGQEISFTADGTSGGTTLRAGFDAC